MILALNLLSTAISAVTWTQISGQLKQIQLDADFGLLCGVNNFNDIYCSKSNKIEWYQIPGKLKEISTSRGQLFGVDDGDKVWYSSSLVKGQANLVQVPGSLRQISFDGYTVCGANKDNQIYCADENLSTSPNWYQINGSLKQVVIRNNEIYGVNSANEIFYSSTIKNPTWIKLPGSLKQISFDGSVLCGTTVSSDVYCASKDLITNPKWEQISGKLTHISVDAGGELVGVNVNGNVYLAKYGITNLDLNYPIDLPPDSISPVLASWWAPQLDNRKGINFTVIHDSSPSWWPSEIVYMGTFYQRHINGSQLVEGYNVVVNDNQNVELELVATLMNMNSGESTSWLQSTHAVDVTVYDNLKQSKFVTRRIINLSGYRNGREYSIDRFGIPSLDGYFVDLPKF